MKKAMRKFLAVLPLIGLLVSLSACREEIDPGQEPGGGISKTKDITFMVGGSDTDTKSAKTVSKGLVTDMIPLDIKEGEIPVFLEESVASLDDCYYPNSTATKGHPVYTQNFGSLYWEFGGDAYEFTQGSGSATPASVENLTKFTGKKPLFYLSSAADATPLTYKYEFDGQWPKSNPNLLFFMSAPTQTAGSYVGGVTKVDYFYVSGKDAGVTKFTYTTPAEVVNQKDILFTSKSLSRDEYNKNYEASKATASVLFYHTLAGVKFKAGNVGDGVTTITQITVSGIKNQGTCTVKPQFDTDGYVCDGSSNTNTTENKTAKSSVVSTWEPSGSSTGTYTIGNGTSAISINQRAGKDESGNNLFPGSFYGDTETNNLAENNFMDENFDNVFFFMPQETPEGATITIKYTIKRKAKTGESSSTGYIEQQYTKTVKFNGRIWKAGEIYTYTLTARDLDVYITDNMGKPGSTHATKTDVAITNMGNINAYMRVAVVANWFDNHEQKATALAPGHVITNKIWDINTEISSGRLVIDTTNWSPEKDSNNKYTGVFYYKHQVAPGATISQPIFTSYTAPTEGHASDHLEMDLAVQAVDAALRGTDNWPWSNATGLANTVDNGETIQ